jgi:signal transduction histidine kinase
MVLSARMSASHFEESQPAKDLELVRRSARRWRRVLCLTLLLMIVLIWAMWAETTAYDRHQALSAAARRQGNMAVAVGHYLNRALGNAEAVTQYLTTVHASPASDFPQQLQTRTRVNTLFTDMVACGEDGAVLSGKTPSKPGAFTQACASWLREAPADARVFPGRPMKIAEATLVPLLTRMEPAADRPAAVLALLVDVRAILGLLQDYSIPDETVVLLAGTDGQPRARWHSTRNMADQRAPEAAVLADALAAGTLGLPRTVEGRDVLVTARRIEPHQFVVLISTSVPDTLAAPRERSGRFAIAGALATAVVIAFAALLLRLQSQASRTAESLARARLRLQSLNEELEAKVLARTGALEAAYRDLEAFSYSVAHDVRGPLGAIRGFADALGPTVEATGAPKAAHYLRRIVANTTQLTELTEALLELGKLSRAPLEATRLDLTAKAHDVVAALREREPGRDVRVRIQDGMAARGDRRLVRQVLENLIGNAWKFSKARAPAEISVETVAGEPGWVTVAIRDNGEGFDSTSAPELFKPFRRMHRSEAFPGTGVGLAIVKKIMERHGGQVRIDSSPEGGTSVYFTLPAADGPA